MWLEGFHWKLVAKPGNGALIWLKLCISLWWKEAQTKQATRQAECVWPQKGSQEQMTFFLSNSEKPRKKSHKQEDNF